MSNLNFIGNVAGIILAFAVATNGYAAGEQTTGGNHPGFSGMWTRGATVTTPFRAPRPAPARC